MTKMKRFLIFAFCFLLSLSCYAADTWIKQVVHRHAFSLLDKTYEDEEEEIETWIGRNRMAVHGKSQSLLLLLDREVLYVLDHNRKTYVQMPIPIDLEEFYPAQLLQLMQTVTVNLSVADESVELDRRTCHVFQVEIESLMMSMRIKVWGTVDVPFDWKVYKERMYPELAKVLFKLPEEAAREFSEIAGFPYRSESVFSFMGVEVRSEMAVVSMDRKAVPDNVYSLPENYTQKERFTLDDIKL